MNQICAAEVWKLMAFALVDNLMNFTIHIHVIKNDCHEVTDFFNVFFLANAAVWVTWISAVIPRAG